MVAHRVDLDYAAVGQNFFGKAAGVAHDVAGHLVSGQASDGPCAKAHSVDRRNALHSKVVAEQCGNVAKASAVARVDNDEERHAQNHKRGLFAVNDSASRDDNRSEQNRKRENPFVNCVAVLKSVGGGAKA